MTQTQNSQVVVETKATLREVHGDLMASDIVLF